MSLAERLHTAPAGRAKQFCTVGALLVDLEPGAGAAHEAEYNALAGALSTPSWSASALQRVLAEEGYRVSDKHIRAHRNGEHTEAQCARPTVGVLQRPGA